MLTDAAVSVVLFVALLLMSKRWVNLRSWLQVLVMLASWVRRSLMPVISWAGTGWLSIVLPLRRVASTRLSSGVVIWRGARWGNLSRKFSKAASSVK